MKNPVNQGIRQPMETGTKTDTGALVKKSAGSRSAAEAGWHLSRYNVAVSNPDGDGVLIANTFRGRCGAFSSWEWDALSSLDEMEEDHPLIRRFALRGIVTNIDERAMLETRGRMSLGNSRRVALTICPTMACNFDCPYCFENHRAGRMSEQVQDEVVSLAGRMMKAAKADRLTVTWFGGEPLLALEVIASLSERLKAVAAQSGAEYHASIITNGYLLTQEAADTLARASVEKAQITLDGLGPTHDATRRLAGGGPTFARITENLKTVRLPFRADIRHNVHTGNVQEMKPLEAFVQSLAAESGNHLRYYAAPVLDNPAAESRHSQVETLCGSAMGEIGILRNILRPIVKKGHFCGANSLYHIGVDDRGNLQKCWEDVDKPERSFARAAVWDPANPFRSADHPDRLTCYLNAAPPLEDLECRECVWLPFCMGGCPTRRIYARKLCYPYKDNPEQFVLDLFRQKAEERVNESEPLPFKRA